MKTAPDPSPACPPAGPRHGVALPLLAAVLVMVTTIIIPNAPFDLKVDADTSTSAVLNYAHQQGLQFGTDLVYLYGPLGRLLYFYYSPNTVTARFVVDAVFCFAVAAGLCLVAWHLRWVGRCLLLGLFLFVAANAEFRTDLLIYTGLLCWGLLCFIEADRRLAVAVGFFIALAALGALAKTLVLLIGSLGVLLIAADLAMRRQWRLALLMPPAFATTITLGWLACGQDFRHLDDWLVTSLAVAQGYSQSMGWEGLPQAFFSGLAVVLVASAMVLIRAWTAFNAPCPRIGCRRLLLLLWLAALLFLSWKHGFGRGDSFHLAYFFGFVPVLALALEVLPGESPRARRWARGLGAACCVLSVVTLQSLFFPSGLRSLEQPVRLFRYHARCLLKPADYRARMDAILQTKRREAQLPALRRIIGQDSVDVFGQHPIHALLNDLNYRPRPVFQSYVACNARLMRFNEQFYLSTAAPQYVMFSLGPIDRRFAPLEDAMLLRHLLLNYEPVGAEGDFLLLQRKSSQPPRLTPLREGTVRPGQRIDLKDFGNADLWLEVRLEPTWLGRLRQLLYQVPPVRLAAWQDEAPKPLLARRRAPPAMLAAGFVASPLLLRNNDLQRCDDCLPPSRPTGYSIELLPGHERFWQSRAQFRILEIHPAEVPIPQTPLPRPPANGPARAETHRPPPSAPGPAGRSS